MPVNSMNEQDTLSCEKIIILFNTNLLLFIIKYFIFETKIKLST